MKWQDISSYSQSDKVRRPDSFEIKAGRIRIVLVWDHRHVSDTWSTSMYGIYENVDLKLVNYEDIETAKNKALEMAKDVLQCALNVLEDK